LLHEHVTLTSTSPVRLSFPYNVTVPVQARTALHTWQAVPHYLFLKKFSQGTAVTIGFFITIFEDAGHGSLRCADTCQI